MKAGGDSVHVQFNATGSINLEIRIWKQFTNCVPVSLAGGCHASGLGRIPTLPLRALAQHHQAFSGCRRPHYHQTSPNSSMHVHTNDFLHVVIPYTDASAAVTLCFMRRTAQSEHAPCWNWYAVRVGACCN